MYDDSVNYYMIGQSPCLKIVKFSNHKFPMKNNTETGEIIVIIYLEIRTYKLKIPFDTKIKSTVFADYNNLL